MSWRASINYVRHVAEKQPFILAAWVRARQPVPATPQGQYLCPDFVRIIAERGASGWTLKDLAQVAGFVWCVWQPGAAVRPVVSLGVLGRFGQLHDLQW